MTKAARRGFTLIEVVVALAVAAIVVLIARQVSGAIADTNRQLTAVARAADADAIAEQTLRVSLAGISIMSSDSAAFAGTPRAATYRSWCQTSGGWRERCTMTLAVATESRTVALVLRATDLLIVRREFDRAELCYLESAESGGAWTREWARSGALPLAIGVVVDGDTAIFPLGRTG